MAPTRNTSGFRSVTGGVSDSLLKAYKAGGFGLAVLTLGAILMLAAFFWNAPDAIRYITLATGASLTFFTLGYVYFKEFPKIKRAQESLLARKEMVDTIQQAAIDLTDLADDLQELALENARQVAVVLKAARPIIRNIPRIGRLADSKVVVRTEELSVLITNIARRTRTTIRALKEALIQGDVKYMKKLMQDLQSYRAEMETMLRAKNRGGLV